MNNNKMFYSLKKLMWYYVYKRQAHVLEGSYDLDYFLAGSSDMSLYHIRIKQITFGHLFQALVPS